MEEILSYFPETISKKIKENWLENMEEIRIRVNRPIILKNSKTETMLPAIVLPQTILQILQKICDNSIYSYQNQICQGFITLKGGHRVGVTGNAVMKEGQVINLNYINSLNFRIARQVFNCSNEALVHVLDIPNHSIFNTLLVSPPGRGKTTILRDAIRKISSGISEISFQGLACGVVDERGEISATYQGIAQNDIGTRTDIIDNIPKAIGMKMLIRSMSPKVIAADEIGSKEDIEAIEYAVCSGVKGIFTAHGSNMKDIKKNPILGQLLEKQLIEKILFIEENRKISLAYDSQKQLFQKEAS